MVSDTQQNLAARVAALGPWVTGFTVDGRKYGGDYVPASDPRVWLFVEHLKKTGRAPADILECGCLEGGHTAVLAAQFPEATIHAVEVREENLAKARLLTELARRANVSFFRDDLDAPTVTFARGYDAIFCVGLLYHLRWPEEFLRRACAAAPVLWLWTVYCAEHEVARTEGVARGRDLWEPTAAPTAAVRPESFLPSLGSLVEYLWAAGYTNVNLVRKEMTANGNGPAVMLCASR